LIQIKRTAGAALLAGLALGACAATQAAKDAAYTRAAERGNLYCQLRDASLVESAGDIINAGLRDHGAEFEFKAEIICDP